jgi:hypothetical protein
MSSFVSSICSAADRVRARVQDRYDEETDDGNMQGWGTVLVLSIGPDFESQSDKNLIFEFHTFTL